MVDQDPEPFKEKTASNRFLVSEPEPKPESFMGGFGSESGSRWRIILKKIAFRSDFQSLR